jgi:hypothetical protein
MVIKLGRHGINAEKGQIRFYLDKKISPYSCHRIAMDRKRVTKIEDKYAKSCQESLVYLPVFCQEQVDKEKGKKNQGAYFVGILKLKYYPDKVI